jgi:hypothetical protein
MVRVVPFHSWEIEVPSNSPEALASARAVVIALDKADESSF